MAESPEVAAVDSECLDVNGDQSMTELPAEEICSIVVHNWPPFVGSKDGRKLFTRLGLSPKKVCPVGDHVYLTFENGDLMSLAMEKLNGYVLKKRTLRVRRAGVDWSKSREGIKRLRENNLSISDVGTIVDVVTPWHNVPYPEQLERKQTNCLEFLMNLSAEISGISGEPVPTSGHYGTLETILASPKEDSYRNKCEFSVGYNNGVPEVGFRLCRHREGCTVAPVDDCKHIPTMMKSVVNRFRNYVLSSASPPYNVDTKQGFWRMLTVRCYQMDILIIITVNPSGLDPKYIEQVKKELLEHFLYQDMVAFRISSVYYQELVNSSDEVQYELLGGCPFVYERLFNMRFRISPSSFFQVNTKGCEVLYKAIDELCKSTEAEVLLDICCGTGTIGICLACNYKKVIGIEVVDQAIEDARENASANETNQCEYFCGKAESLIYTVSELQTVAGSKCVAVLDPPRAGIGQNVIVALRKCDAVRFLVYISCDKKGATKNFVDLSRRTSNRFPGNPFVLKKVCPVDMFPMTEHYELLMLFEKRTNDDGMETV
uniref:tRNA (uracil(54)-C(5))-methyltransferase n=1 Tax=Trichuris muris TaxID=70415 RepID=A0A5S6QET4_TRIMR